MVVHNEDEAYKLYNDYAIRMGFSIRKNKLRCSKEGFPQDSDRLDDKKFKKLQIRTSCEASKNNVPLIITCYLNKILKKNCL
ncbi:hypothetical protein ACB092_02G006700 [Castanea dentata]